MYLNEEYVETKFTRLSKLGVEHEYTRTKTLIVFRCDNCKEIFRRDKGSMSPKRLSNNYFHCCQHCDAKRFAQKKEQKGELYGTNLQVVWMTLVNCDIF